MARKAFSIHSDFYSVLESLNTEQRGNLFLALVRWAEDDSPVELDQACTMLFTLMTAQIERVSTTNSANGAQGGRPSGKSEESGKSETKRKKPTVSVTVSDTVTNTDTDISKGICAKSDFDSFWAAYPKKKSKGDAEKAWKSIKPSKELVATMLEKLAQATTCPDWTKENGKFIPYPATWLRAKGWEDELTAPNGNRYTNSRDDSELLKKILSKGGAS